MQRQIDQKIENHIDQIVGKRLIIPYAQTMPVKLQIMALEAMLGIHEEGGNNSGALVESIQKTVGIASKEPWCMSLQQTAIAYVEKKTLKKCLVPVGEHCLTVFKEAKKLSQDVDLPAPGDLIFWQLGDTKNGHVGCTIEEGDDHIRTIEGNTSSGDGIKREGDGVYAKIRSLVGNSSMAVIGFVRPKYV